MVPAQQVSESLESESRSQIERLKKRWLAGVGGCSGVGVAVSVPLESVAECIVELEEDVLCCSRR